MATVERFDRAIATLHVALDSSEDLILKSESDDRILAAIRLHPRPHRQFFSIRDWLIAGVVLALSMLLIPFGEDFARIAAVFGSSYTLPLALVLGSLLSVYGALFVAAHIKEVESFVRRIPGLR